VRVLIDYRSALRSRSGAGEYAHNLARALVARSHRTANDPIDLSLFSSSWKDRLSPDILAGTRTIDRRVPVSLLNFAWHRMEWPPVELLAGGPFDVAHSMHPLLMPARRAAQVVTIFDLNFLAHPERTRSEVRRDYPALTRQHAHRADRIIVASRFTASEVERLLEVPADRISVCPAGAPDWTPRTSVPAMGYVLFLGTLEPRKNLGTLLDAYERLLATWAPAGGGSTNGVPDLILAGRAIPESRPWLDRLARPPLAGHARHVGYVKDEHLQALYEGACLLVQPSFEEGFGIPVLEAMTLGIPVVAANRGSLPEVLGDTGVLVDPDDSGGMAEAMRRLASDAGMAAACASAGRTRSRAFQWTETADRVAEAYHLAVERRARRPRGRPA
jgi:glycosyltransferase involved in cell wall biosynthesis